MYTIPTLQTTPPVLNNISCLFSTLIFPREHRSATETCNKQQTMVNNNFQDKYYEYKSK